MRRMRDGRLFGAVLKRGGWFGETGEESCRRWGCRFRFARWGADFLYRFEAVTMLYIYSKSTPCDTLPPFFPPSFLLTLHLFLHP
ncbi:hypothetical protein B0H12DRAFT_218731 [Mycena haematopus]|nr:hypothetical protein B0H12DRAFT_218731 [Mycena haematopus]